MHLNRASNNLIISIITVVYNAEKYLEDTISSIVDQTYDNIEYIIIDGNSSDNSAHIIKKYDPCLSYWVSEPDDGISDAMNKGIKVATGDYLLFLHADDYLLNKNVIQSAVDIIKVQMNDLYAFQLYFGNSKQKKIMKSRQFNLWTNVKTGIWHQAVFFRNDVFSSVGLYDTSLKIAVDYDWFLRAYRKGLKLTIIDKPVSMMRDIGLSSSKNKNLISNRLSEEKKIHYRHCNSFLKKIFYRIWWLIYPIYKLR